MTDVRIGDLLVVRPGDLIPVDGTIISGRAQIDESALTENLYLKIKILVMRSLVALLMQEEMLLKFKPVK